MNVPTDLRSRFRIVLAREAVLASRAARAVHPSKPITVWEALLPFVLIVEFIRMREVREHFEANHLVTKRLALEAAKDIEGGSVSEDAVWSRVGRDTQAVLDKDLGEVYTDGIRQAQMREVETLVEHYRRLIVVPGSRYADLVLAAYESKSRYAAFAERLVAAELLVMDASLQSFGDRVDPGFVARLKEVAARVRREDVEEVFSES